MSIKPPDKLWTVTCDYCKRNKTILYFRQKQRPTIKQIENYKWLCFSILNSHTDCCPKCVNGDDRGY